jgi:hypothetical protein
LNSAPIERCVSGDIAVGDIPAGSERVTRGCVGRRLATKRRAVARGAKSHGHHNTRSRLARRGAKGAIMNKWIILAACLAAAGCNGKTVAGQADAAQVGGGDPGIAKSAGDQVAAAAADSAYGAREPRTNCPSKFPGPPTARQAMDLFICGAEKHIGGYLYLVSDVTVQIGRSRPYSAYSDGGATDIDSSAAVWPIQGRFTSYQCSRRDAMLGADPNRNCLRTDVAQAPGACYLSTFGEWRCALSGVGGVFMAGNQPPPVGG